jgi:diguanylate cyclase (GGDEF)-like protein
MTRVFSSREQPIAVEPPERGCDLVPVPAAHLVREGSGFAFEAYNIPYRLAGLGIVAERSPMLQALGARIDAFLSSSELQSTFDWSFGAVIDCRYYQVTLARPSVRRRDACAITFLDQTAQVNSERTLRREMTTDSLTGLTNRVGFSDLLEAVDVTGGRYAVLVINLDRFGRLNACLGSLAGDELLITIARRIKGVLRARDALARIGGDEFGVLIETDEGSIEAAQLAARIDRALADPFRLSDYEIGVAASIGIAVGNAEIDDPEDLVRNAQFAVKRAKSSGRVELYQPRAFSIAREQFAMETALRRAIDGNELRLAYQPIYDLASGQIVSFEALARWTDSEGRAHSPNDFIPVAEESGLIVPLGRWAIDQAAAALARWDKAAGGDCGIKLAVNLSAIQLHRDQITWVIEDALARNRVEGHRFTLELTESAIIGEPDRIGTIMESLKGLGCTLAMDDFGTGYSNLAYLQRLPIDVLKIDRSFVTGMLADRDKVAIVRAVLGLAQALGMWTTAEGVETVELAQTLAALGCSYGQGYYYARPLEEADALAMLVPTASSAI